MFLVSLVLSLCMWDAEFTLWRGGNRMHDLYICKTEKREEKSFFHNEISRRKNQFKGVVCGGQLHTSPVLLHGVCN